MIFDCDDLFEGHDRMDLLLQLKAANPLFRMTAFAVPAYCPDGYLDSLPVWIEVVAHGWAHGGRDCSDPREAEQWTYGQTLNVLESLHPRFVQGWKSPGWQVSDGTYEALLDVGWWCADHPDNDARRPDGLRTHVVYAGDHAHHHIQDWGSNGLCESWATLYPRVTAATSFELVSEAVRPWRAKVAA